MIGYDIYIYMCVCFDFKVNQTCQKNEKWPNEAIDLDQLFDCELINN